MELEVYKITNKVNGKIYIGITNQGVATRWYKHTSDSRGNSTFPLHNAIRKYGTDNFQIDVIEVVDDVEVLKERECYWIKEFNSYDRSKGYNLTLGGDGTFGRFHSQETKNKIRQKALGRVRSTQSKENQSKSIKEHNIFNHNEMSERAKKGNTIRWSNPESRKNASLSNVNNKIILQFDKEMNFITEHRSASEAARLINKTHQNICNCAKGKLKTAYGFIWKYKEDVNK